MDKILELYFWNIVMEDLNSTIRSLGEKGTFDYILLITTIASIIISACAVFVAIKVPKQIAEQQNKIALFEKRYNFYLVLKKFELLNNSLNRIIKPITNKSIESIQCLFVIIFGSEPDLNIQYDKNKTYSQAFKYFMQAKNVLDSASFLFNIETERYIEQLIDISTNLLNSSDPQDIEDNIKKYHEKIKDIKEKILPIVKKNLNLN
ncbi:hypothetical protein [Anaerotignum sp.]|uniref:hypothetical protein n=1 Tax=Anaerotignum sp. TaxID=2039241 RepID=UPI00033E661E|nr:hypothetical protein [Anaerotignum sp.]MDY5415088.1 hypothetical protein [Anaerotignum sp.]CDC28962.1 unknown [Firmicutes bacterium CAG:466]